MSMIKDIRVELISNVIWEILIAGLALLLTSTTISFLATFASTTIEVLSPFKWWVAGISFLGGALGFSVGYRRFRRFRPRYPAFRFKYKLIEKVIIHEYTSRNHVIHKRRFLLKAREQGLDRYLDKYHWTGEGHLDLRSTVTEHDVRHANKRNVWNFYEIVFERHLNKKETIQAEV